MAEVDYDEAVPAIETVVRETRSGWRTTEFWITVATSLLVVVNGIPLPEKYEGVVVAALAAVYALARGLAKAGTPVVEAHPTD